MRQVKFITSRSETGAVLHRSIIVLCGVALNLCLFGAGTGSAAVAATPQAPEQSFYVRSWAVSDGTSANSVMGVIRRTDGYLWVVTRFGLFRFDGEEFKPFQKIFEKVAPGVLQYAMLHDSRGRLWLTTRQGSNSVVCAEGHTVRAFSDKEGLPPMFCPESIAEDDEGAIWLSYAHGPLYRIEEGRVQAMSAAVGLEGNQYTALISDAQRRIWYARGRQVGLLRDERLIPLVTHEQPVTRLAVARDGGLLFSDGKKIWKYRVGRQPEWLGTLPSGEVELLIEDQRGRVWVAVNTGTAGFLFCHEGSGFRSVPVVCPYIVSLSDDLEGNIWVGTRRSGLIQVRPRSVELTTPVAKVPNDIQSFCETTDGIRFAIGVEGTLVRSHGTGWVPMNSEQGWPGHFAEAVAADPRGGVWIGTRTNGLFHWQGGTFTSVCGSTFASVWGISPILECSNGDLWLGTRYTGIFRVRDGKPQAFELSPGQYVTSLAEDSAGTVWVGTEYGLLSCVNGDKMVDPMPKVGEVQHPINCLLATPDGSLWMGYGSLGLGRLKHGLFFLYGKEQGLEERGISEIVSDGRGFLWCAGMRGLFSLKLEELKSVAAGEGKLHPFFCGYGEGLPVLQGSSESWPRAARSRSGELFMATGSGLAIVHPERSRAHQLPPPAVVIERVSLNGRLVAQYDAYLMHAGSSASPAVELNGLERSFSLGQGVRQLGVEFTTVSFKGYEHVKFQYRLEGLDDDWVEAGSQKAAYYSQLSPGKYRFRVKACNNEGTWNEKDVALELIVEPYLWETVWFRVGWPLTAFGVLGGMVVLWLRRRYRQQLERLELQQATEKERMRIARDLHDDLGAGLTQISLVNALTQVGATEAEKGAASSKVNELALDLVRSLDEIVWAVRPQNDNLPSLVEYLANAGRGLCEGSDVRCWVTGLQTVPELEVSASVRHNLLMAFREAVNNVLKHAGATEVRIRLHLEAGDFTVEITDNGCGFDVAKGESKCSGLLHIRQRLTEIGGRCEMNSVSGQGTTVLLSFPLATSKSPARGISL